MANNGPIREVRLATEANYGVAAASGYFKAAFDGSPNRQDEFQRKLMVIQNGTLTGKRLRALAGRHSTFNLKVPLLYDQAGYFLTHLFGQPATTPLGSGAYRHMFQFPIPVSGLSGTSLWLSASALIYNNVRWVQMLGCRANTGKFTIDAANEPYLEVAYVGQPASNYTDPVPELDMSLEFGATAIGPRDLIVNTNGVDAALIKATFDVDNKLVPFWTARRSASMNRLKRNGLADFKFDATFDWLQYTGSVKEKFDTEADLGDMEIEFLNSSLNIGTSAIHPRFYLHAHNLIIENTDEPDDNGESANHATGSGDFEDATYRMTASAILENGVASYAGS